jgi:glutamate-1-semialdehyde 2,1-aminomutase
MFSVFFVQADVRAVRNYDEASGQSTSAYAAFFHSMLDSGIYLPPSAYEAWFLSATHDDGVMDKIVSALPTAAAAAARHTGGQNQ